VRYAFEEVGMERVIAGADAPNSASLRVIEKLGMQYLGDINPRAPEEPYFALYRGGLLRDEREGLTYECPTLVPQPRK
jgi:RimJ/RimL family protein N-acetyltransferase